MIDSHCHLAGEEFAGDLREVVTRAHDAGVTSALCILSSGDAEEFARARTVAEAWWAVRFSVGVHPHNAGKAGESGADPIVALREEIRGVSACGIGEIGLDYHYDFSPRDVQQDLFRRQLALARELQLPVVIHTREATDDTFAILRECGAEDLRGVFHCFTGDREMARRALDIGFYISFSGIVTFPKAEELREVARMTPADRFLIETDAPYLAPVPHRGKRNEPAFVVGVAEALARVRGTSIEDVGAASMTNFASLFGPNPLPSNGLAR